MFSVDAIRQIIRMSLQPITATRHPLYSPAAEEILLMIAAHESAFGLDLRQIGGGPARGLCQVELGTMRDHYLNFINHKPALAQQIEEVTGVSGPSEEHLTYNPLYNILMARLKLYRSPGKLPSASDAAAMASYCKQHYNTRFGAATVDKYMYDYFRLTETA